MPDPLRFAPAASPEDDLLRGYQRATSFSPIQKDQRDKVFKEYGLKSGVSKGKNDTSLEHTAAEAVISWFQRQQKAKAAKPSASGSNSKPSGPATRTSGSSARGGSRQASGPTMPDTGMAAPAVAPAYIRKQMAAYGFKTQPPAYALVSTAAFDAWLARAVRYMSRPRSQTITQTLGIQRVQGPGAGGAAPTPAKPARVGGFSRF